MSDIAIRVENVSKYYRLGLIGGRTLHDDFERWWAKVRGKPNPLLKIGQEDYANRQGEYIWALRDVSFQVQQGEVVGIIGRNGAGKSTLLKILSRVTAPTSGQVKVKGRVASLLEVGTGFHPELTGRENIYLNGAILGMKKAEIERKFDEIVAFAEIEKFMDTPVKRYSSGMYVRLAFAVAAHLEPEILLVDEVLAVGDAAFQKKCLGKMGDVAREGRTVLFVSHNMPSVLQLCSRGILLESGRIIVTGNAESVVYSYLRGSAPLTGERYFATPQPSQSDTKELVFTGIRVLGHEKIPSAHIGLTNGLCIEIFYKVNKPVRSAQVGFLLWNSKGICVLTSTDWDGDLTAYERKLDVGEYVARCYIPGSYLRPGRYWIDIASSIPKHRMLAEIQQSIAFEVVDDGSLEMRLSQGRLGVIEPLLDWTFEKIA